MLASQVPEIIKIENIEELEATLLESNPFEELPELTKVELIELLNVEPDADEHELDQSCDEQEDDSDKDEFLIEIDDTNIPPTKRAAYRNMKKDALINNFYVFICPTCDITLRTWADYRNHIIHNHDTHRPKFRCCETSLECERWNLLGHYYFHTSPDLLKCKKCNRQFNNIRAYRKHHKESHVKTSEELKCTCPHCGVIMLRKSLSQHLKLHQTQHKLQCDICKLLTSTRSSLILHMKRRHLPRDDGQILCNICARSFCSKERFNQHNRYYHDDTTGECPHCGVVKKLEHLRIHIKRVHRENKVTCEICAKEFLNKIKLKGHQLQVHVEKKFECDVCRKKYKTKAKMKEHRATHFGELRFK